MLQVCVCVCVCVCAAHCPTVNELETPVVKRIIQWNLERPRASQTDQTGPKIGKKRKKKLLTKKTNNKKNAKFGSNASTWRNVEKCGWLGAATWVRVGGSKRHLVRVGRPVETRYTRAVA